MKNFDDNQVINGQFGEVWIDSTYVAQATALEAKITLEKSEVQQSGRLSKGYKITGLDGKGTIKLTKLTSLFVELLSDNMKTGKQTACTIISKLEDPSSLGAERIKLTGCTFDELTLVNWELKKLGEESIPFTFTDWEVLDKIEQSKLG